MYPSSVRFSVLCGWLFVLVVACGVQGQSVPSGGVRLVAPTDLAVQGNFWQGSTTGGVVASRAIVPVVGQSFTQAARVSVLRPTGEFWASAISAPSTQALEQGDVVLIHVFIRAIETQDETGSVFMQVYAEGPAPGYSKSLSQQVSAGPGMARVLPPVCHGRRFSRWAVHLQSWIWRVQPAAGDRGRWGRGAGLWQDPHAR
jgi:hypothetical protein